MLYITINTVDDDFIFVSFSLTWLTNYSCVRLLIVFYVHKFKQLMYL